jgi:hypothetical protein
VDCAAASVLRPARPKASAATAMALAATPAIAPRLRISLLIPASQVIEPKRLYHAVMVNGKLPFAH